MGFMLLTANWLLNIHETLRAGGYGHHGLYVSATQMGALLKYFSLIFHQGASPTLREL